MAKQKQLHKHYFVSEVASEVGVIPAIIFENIYYWVMQNKYLQRDQVYKDGKYWTYGSIATLQKRFPYLSSKQVRTGVDTLIKAELIEAGNYNKKTYDKTKWYTITEKGYDLMSGTIVDEAEEQEGQRVF